MSLCRGCGSHLSGYFVRTHQSQNDTIMSDGSSYSDNSCSTGGSTDGIPVQPCGWWD